MLTVVKKRFEIGKIMAKIKLRKERYASFLKKKPEVADGNVVRVESFAPKKQGIQIFLLVKHSKIKRQWIGRRSHSLTAKQGGGEVKKWKKKTNHACKEIKRKKMP